MSQGFLAFPSPNIDNSLPVRAECTMTGGAPAVTVLGSFVVLNYNIVVDDPWRAVRTGTAWRFYAPLDGVYLVQSTIEFVQTYAGSNSNYLRCMVYSASGVLYKQYSMIEGQVGGRTFSGAVHVKMRANESCNVQLNLGGGNSTSNNVNTNANMLNIERMGKLTFP
jgi:hypothetical protein